MRQTMWTGASLSLDRPWGGRAEGVNRKPMRQRQCPLELSVSPPSRVSHRFLTSWKSSLSSFHTNTITKAEGASLPPPPPAAPKPQDHRNMISQLGTDHQLQLPPLPTVFDPICGSDLKGKKELERT